MTEHSASQLMISFSFKAWKHSEGLYRTTDSIKIYFPEYNHLIIEFTESGT